MGNAADNPLHSAYVSTAPISFGPLSPEDILFTHPDVSGCYNSPPTTNNVISSAAPLAPGANQPLVVTGGSSSTARPTDANRKIVGQVPGGSVAISNPA